MNKRTLLCGGILLTIGATISVISLNKNISLFSSIADSQKYSITLSDSNSYSSGSSKNISTDSGASTVAFEYTNCTSKSGYHASMAYGATIKNTQQITSIQKIEAS